MTSGFTQDATLQELIPRFKAFAATPALIAIGDATLDTWSFARLAGAAEKLAAGLIGKGIGRGEPVGLLGPNSPRWVVTYLAIINAGAVAMPLDERAGQKEIERLLEGSGCRWLVTTGRYAGLFASSSARGRLSIITMDQSAASDRWSVRWDSLLAEPAVQIPSVVPQDIATIVHTSGTTGTPKAVPLSHANLMSNIAALAAERLIGAGDRALLPLPFHHVYPLTVGLLTPLAVGATVVLPAGVSGPELAMALRTGGITHLVGVPRLYTALLAEIRSRVRARGKSIAATFAILLAISGWLRRSLHLRAGRLIFRSLHRRIAPRLRFMVSGGAALEIDTERALEGLGWEALSGYGLTETSPILAFNRRSAKRAGTAGRPLPGVELRIAEPAADGTGEIQARGPCVFAGYRNDPAATRTAFTADGWFRTGDLGFLDREGYLHVTGRRTETIVLPGGKKLNPETVEKAYAELPVLRELAVLAPEGVLVALVVPNLDEIRRRGSERAEELIRQALAARGLLLPPHQRFAGFAVTREPLPRTHLGKLRRHLLPALYARAQARREPAVAVALSAEDRDLLASPIAERLWAWLKTRFPDRSLSLDTSPQLDLGIDSLGWINLSLEMQRSVRVTMTEASMARVVTLRDLLREAVTLGDRPAETAEGKAAEPAFAPGPESSTLRLIRRSVAYANRVAVRAVFRLRVMGLENLPPSGPCLICPNHASYLDPFVLAAALPYHRLRRTWWAGWTGILFAGPLRRGFSRMAQVLPIDPDRAAASGLALGAGVLARGFTFVWFPEGVRSGDGRLQKFQPGVGALLENSPALVVPTYIAGTFDAWPRNRRLPRPRRATVIFGAPRTAAQLRATGEGASDAERIADGLRAAVASLAPGAQA